MADIERWQVPITDWFEVSSPNISAVQTNEMICDLVNAKHLYYLIYLRFSPGEVDTWKIAFLCLLRTIETNKEHVLNLKHNSALCFKGPGTQQVKHSAVGKWYSRSFSCSTFDSCLSGNLPGSMVALLCICPNFFCQLLAWQFSVWQATNDNLIQLADLPMAVCAALAEVCGPTVAITCASGMFRDIFFP